MRLECHLSPRLLGKPWFTLLVLVTQVQVLVKCLPFQKMLSTQCLKHVDLPFKSNRDNLLLSLMKSITLGFSKSLGMKNNTESCLKGVDQTCQFLISLGLNCGLKQNFRESSTYLGDGKSSDYSTFTLLGLKICLSKKKNQMKVVYEASILCLFLMKGRREISEHKDPFLESRERERVVS